MDSTDTKSSHLWRLFGFTFAITASYILCRAVADAVLLSRLGSNSLPTMIVLGALTAGIVSFAWARRTRKQKLKKVIRNTQLGSAFATGCVFLFLDTYPDSFLVIGSLYLLAEIRSCLNAILIALLLNDDGDRETDKRPFALVNAGAPLAGIISGIFIGAEATVLSSSTLLVLCCGFDLIAWAILSRFEMVSRALISARKLVPESASTVDASADQHQQSLGQSLSLGKLILSVVVCKTVVLTLIDYEWKVFAADHYSASETQLTSYFGVFYAVSDALTLVFQLVIARYFLRPRTMTLGLYLLPVYLIVIATATLLTDSAIWLFWLMTFARGSLVVRRGLYDVIVQVLYGWLPRKSRRASVAHILGVGKPIAEAVTAVSILGFATFVPAQTFTWLWLPALLTWAIVLERLMNFWKQMPPIDTSNQPALADQSGS